MISFPHPKTTAREALRTRCIARSVAHYSAGMANMRVFKEFLEI